MSNKLFDLIREIMNKEGLKKWTLVIYSGSSDGLCLHEIEKIYVGKKFDPPLMLALHEIAHAQCSKPEDIYGHNNIWAGKYERLLRKYLLKIKGIK